MKLERQGLAVFLAAGALRHMSRWSCLCVVPVTFPPHGKKKKRSKKDPAEVSMYVTHIMEPLHLHHGSFHRLDRDGWYSGTGPRSVGSAIPGPSSGPDSKVSWSNPKKKGVIDTFFFLLFGFTVGL